MSVFSYKEIYIEDGQRVLEMNILPEKYCNFDCIFCPIGKSRHKTDVPRAFPKTLEDLDELSSTLSINNVDLVYINSKGEAFINDKLGEIIDRIKSLGIRVRLLSNGYLLGKDNFLELANRCDEVIGEIKAVTENDFQKLQRPMGGYTLNEYISNMARFRSQYTGTFILEVTIIKGYSDNEAAINRIRKIIRHIAPDKVLVVRIDDPVFQKKLGISDSELKQIAEQLQNADYSTDAADSR